MLFLDLQIQVAKEFLDFIVILNSAVTFLLRKNEDWQYNFCPLRVKFSQNLFVIKERIDSSGILRVRLHDHRFSKLRSPFRDQDRAYKI